ncbi:MAG TPA: hypothetical protein VM581_00895, partial [Magnetospirillaceae bacterium]|nr:hypothetical protein [Magnetospirillaceae bacterium]
IGDSRSLIFSPSLPDGAVESPPESALDLQDVLAKLATFRIVSAARRAVVFIASGSSGVAYAPDETAPEGSTELWLARLLSGPSGKAAISALRARAERSATDIPYHQGVMGRTITLDTDAHSWIWHNEDGSVERCDEYRRGDETINLRQMVAKGIAVPLALNRFSGEMVEVIGLTALSEVAYSGRDGNQFNFLVPCQTGQSRTIHVVVRHETGFMVYGFTVARRSDMNAEADARSRGEDPVRALTRRPVPFGQKVVRNYFVFPDGHRVVHLV